MKLSELENPYVMDSGNPLRVRTPQGRIGTVTGYCPPLTIGGRSTVPHWYLKQDDETELAVRDGEILN